MPLTTTALWPDLVAGKKAKASEVEAKFDWLEGSLFPHNSGNATNNAYDIGTSTYNFRTGYFGTSVYTPALNPTTTASGVAIGKDTANANTCLDLSAMPKALLLPVVTTAQKIALTAAAGMLVYDSTNARIERYEGGQWLPMANYYGFLTATFTASTGAYATALNVSGSGRLLNIISFPLGGATASTYLLPTIDGIGYGTTTSNGTNGAISFSPGGNMASTSVLWVPTYGDTTITASFPINASFKTSITISAKSGIGTSSIRFGYEAV